MTQLHIFAGCVALLAGAVALSAAKGSLLHRRSGLIFAVAMLTMTASAVYIATFPRPNPGNIVAGTLTFYLVATSLLTVRCTVAKARAAFGGLMLVAFAVGATAIALGMEAKLRFGGAIDGIPAEPLFMFGAVALLAALGDALMLRSGHIEGTRRLARHLWRMTFAMWIATTSFFLGQARFIPTPLRRIELLVIPVLLVLVLLVYWLVRVLRQGRRKLGTNAV